MCGFLFPDQVPLPSWPHSRDTLTVWKRHSFCAIQYDDEEEEEEEEEKDEEEDAKSNNDENKKSRPHQDEEQRDTDSSSADNDVPTAENHAGALRRAGETGARVGARGEVRQGDGRRNVGDETEDNSSSSGSDYGGSSVEGLPIGFPNLDMYAFVPECERMPCAQAAPCVYLLLGSQ